MKEVSEKTRIDQARDTLQRLKSNIALHLKGKDDIIEQVVICLIAPGHLLMRLQMGYPDYENEILILQNSQFRYENIELDPVVTKEEVRELQRLVSQVYVEESVVTYILDIVTATRVETQFKAGVSTRGALGLRVAAQAGALMEGRDYVLPEDVLRVVKPVLVHRLTLRRPVADALEERGIIGTVLQQIIDRVPMPV